MLLTPGEERFCGLIREKDQALRRFLNSNSLPAGNDAQGWLAYLVGIKSVLGNTNNDLGFVATLLIKDYLDRRFGITDFDAAGKAQGASGVDIEARSADGLSIIGELKTTKPYQPGFGAAQRTQIVKDLKRLAEAGADHRFMFVVDSDAFAALCRPALASRAPGVEILNLTTGQAFICESST